ncbi:ABC transporter permease [Rhodobacter lacus]|uniref:Spermidine/putrescine transport system permease protein PotC n=1 Tax=Rhodobacter lacus TaxID=1641972 RepID=A0ABW5A8X3_9RHOB
MAEPRPFRVVDLPGVGPTALLVFAGLYAPIVTLVVYSFNAAPSVATWDGFTFAWYLKAWHNDAVMNAAANSLIIASLAALLSTVLATLAALGTTRRPAFFGITAIYAAINQPLMVPEIVTAVALLIVIAAIKAATGYSGLGYLVVAHTAFCIPFAYLPIRARLEGMDLTLETAAADLYASPWQSFRFVTLPQLTPGILAGWMLAFVTSLDDVVITEFIKSPGQDTLPTYMLGQLRRAMTPDINALSAALLGLTLVLLSGFFLLSRRKS